MTKQQSSMSGRGREILLGDPRPVEIGPRGPDLAPADAGQEEPKSTMDSKVAKGEELRPSPSEREPLVDDAELERTLLEEAQAGEPGSAGEKEAMTVPDLEPLPTPEMELALLEEALGAEEHPERAADVPIPTVGPTTEEKELEEEMAIYEPPPAETYHVLPPRASRMVFDMGETETVAYDIQPGDGEVDYLELPERELTEAEEKAMLQRLGSARLQELDEEISKTYDQVLSQVGENEDIATECFNLLLKARDIMLRRDAARIAQAEYYVEQVCARLKRSSDSEAGAKKYAWWITGWGFVWGGVFLALLSLLNHDWFRNIVAPPGTGSPVVDTDIFLPAMLWGGIGGVVAVWYNLFRHVGQRNFDSQHNLSYVGKPFLGLILGATVYMLFYLMQTLGILPAGLQESDGSGFAAVTPWIIYPVAWACGFKENRIFGLVDRLMRRIFSGEKSKSPTPSGKAVQTVG